MRRARVARAELVHFLVGPTSVKLAFSPSGFAGTPVPTPYPSAPGDCTSEVLLELALFVCVLVDDTTYLTESARYGGGEARTRTPVLLLQDTRTDVRRTVGAPTAFRAANKAPSTMIVRSIWV